MKKHRHDVADLARLIVNKLKSKNVWGVHHKQLEVLVGTAPRHLRGMGKLAVKLLMKRGFVLGVKPGAYALN